VVNKKVKPVGVYGTKAGVLVTGVNAAQVRKAMRLLAKCTGRKGKDPRIKTALKLYDVTERFFKNNGRFKVAFTRKKKAK
jgi:hypothetical protein